MVLEEKVQLEWRVGRGRGGGDKKTQRYLGEIFWNTCPPNPLATPACTRMSGSSGNEYWILKSSISWLPAWPGWQPLAQHPPPPSQLPLQLSLLPGLSTAPATDSCWVNECHGSSYTEEAIICPKAPHCQVLVGQALNMKDCHRRNVNHLFSTLPPPTPKLKAFKCKRGRRLGLSGDDMSLNSVTCPLSLHGSVKTLKRCEYSSFQADDD